LDKLDNFRLFRTSRNHNPS